MINATIPLWYDGEGLLPADYACAFLVAMAAIAQFWRCAEPMSSRHVRWWRFVVGFGWTVWSVRLWAALLQGYDPQIAPPGLLAMALVAGGSAMLNILLRKH